MKPLARLVLPLSTSLVVSACGGSPERPSPVPPGPLSLSCPADVNADAGSMLTAQVVFPPPVSTGGQAPVSAECSPASGSTFPLGSSSVKCTAVDAGSQTANCSFRVTVTSGQQLTLTRFMAFGDSITEGYLREPPATPTIAPDLVIPTETYPFKLQQMLMAAYPDDDPVVINEGVGGETLAEGRLRFTDTLLATNPDVVLLLEGYNEVVSTPTASARADLRAMVRSAQVRNVEVLLATLTQITDERERGHPGTQQAIRNLNTEIRKLARDLGLGRAVDLEQAFGGDHVDESLMGSDGLHPNPAGYQRIAETFFSAIAGRYASSAAGQ